MDDAKEYWIFADESVQDGELFSKFFGGCIVPAHERKKALRWTYINTRRRALGFGSLECTGKLARIRIGVKVQVHSETS
jgi:hypothetical protein